MDFLPTPIDGAMIVRQQRIADERGHFARTWCAAEFQQAGLNTQLSQCNISFNMRCGTLRGMHFQEAPYAEAKLVRCTRGELFDVAIDLRPASPTYLKVASATLTQDNGDAFYIPEGCAHGFLTLKDQTEVFYQMSAPFVAHAGRGVRWNDPAWSIDWPASPLVISDRDNTYQDYHP